MNKLQEVKEAMKNTPPERLARIEYQSHFMQMLGVTAVCGILIFQGYWYIIFAFIFSLGISYSQGIGAYQKYRTIKALIGEKEYDVEKEISPSRKRTYIIREVFGRSAGWSVLIVTIFLNLRYVDYSVWYTKILFSFSLIITYIIFYFFIIYWFASKLYYRRKNKWQK